MDRQLDWLTERVDNEEEGERWEREIIAHWKGVRESKIKWVGNENKND